MEDADPLPRPPLKARVLDFVLLCIAGIGLRLFLSEAMLLRATNPTSLTAWGLVCGAVLAAAAILWTESAKQTSCSGASCPKLWPSASSFNSSWQSSMRFSKASVFHALHRSFGHLCW